MSLNYRKFLVIMVTAIILIVAVPNRAHAGLQANKGGKALTNVSANSFFTSIRRMEEQNGTLGKRASLDNKYVDTTGNGIDSHMALNTEFGTVAILSTSEYGFKLTKENDSTTGNESGIYQLRYGKFEYVAGISGSSNVSDLNEDTNINEIAKADARYYNDYSSSKLGKKGDLYNKFDFPMWFPNGKMVLLRSGSDSYYTYSPIGGGSSDRSSRAVVVCGQGL